MFSGGQSYAVHLWEGHRFKEPSQQGLHLLWSLGSALGPIIANPYLVDLHLDVTNETYFDNITMMTQPTNLHGNITYLNVDSPYSNVSLNSSMKSNNFETCMKPDGVENVKFAFIAISTIGICAAIIFFATCLSQPPLKIFIKSMRTSNDTHTDKKVTPKNSSLKFRIAILALLFVFLFFDTVVEVVFGMFLTSFVVKGYMWSSSNGALLATVFWSVHGCGRIIGIPLSVFVKPAWMIGIDLGLMVSGYIVTVFCSLVNISFIWLTVSLAGLGMATVYPSTILWTAETIPFSGKAAAVLNIGATLGGMAGPALTGKLFEDVGHISFVYVILVSGICQSLAFVLMVLLRHFAGSSKCAHDKNIHSVIEAEPFTSNCQVQNDREDNIDSTA